MSSCFLGVLFVVGATTIPHEEDTFFNQFLKPFLDKCDNTLNIITYGHETKELSMILLPITQDAEIYPSFEPLLDVFAELTKHDRVLGGVELTNVQFTAPMQLKLSSLRGFNTFTLTEHSFGQLLEILDFGRGSLDRIRDDGLRADVVNSLIRNLPFDKPQGSGKLCALVRRSDIRALYGDALPVQYMELLLALKDILFRRKLTPTAIIVDARNDEFLSLHIILKKKIDLRSGGTDNTIVWDSSSKELFSHLKAIDPSIGPQTTLCGIRVIASDIGKPEKTIISPYFVEIRCSNGMMMVSPVGERTVRRLPLEEPARKTDLRKSLESAIVEIEKKSEQLYDSYMGLKELPLPNEFEPLDIIYGLRQFSQPGFTPTRPGTSLGSRGKLFAAEDLRAFHNVSMRYRGRIKTVGDLVNLISAAANGVVSESGGNTSHMAAELAWRRVLIQSASGLFITLNREDAGRLRVYIKEWGEKGRKLRNRAPADIDAGDSIIKG
jgi:hypothetical protein